MPAKKKVLLDPHGRRHETIFHPRDLERLNDLVQVVWGRDEPMPAEQYDELKEDVWGIVTGWWRYGDIAEWKNVRAVMEVSGGLPSPKSVDYKHCFANGIRVMSCAPAFGAMVAELALGNAIATARLIVSEHESFDDGSETYGIGGYDKAFSLYDQTVGFVGFGGLANCLKPLLAPFRCKIQAFDPWLPDSFIAKQGAAPVDLPTLMETSKVIFVLAKPTPENKALIDRSLLERIKPDAAFILISRSHLVDFDALTELLIAGRFRAAIDVFPKEPLPADHPIRTAPNVIRTPHRAGCVHEGVKEIGTRVVDDIEAMIAGLPPTQMQSAQPELIFRLA